MTQKSKEAREDAAIRDGERRNRDNGDLSPQASRPSADRGEDEKLSESRPTPGSAEGERDVTSQSGSNVPRPD